MSTRWSQRKAAQVGRLLATMTLAHSLPFATAGRSGVALIGLVFSGLLAAQSLLRGRFVPQLRLGLGLAILGANLVLLASLCLQFRTEGSPVLVVADVALFLFAVQFMETPEEAATAFWRSLWGAVRLAIPVAALTLVIFEIYPDLTPQFSSRIRVGQVGFGTDGELNPGAIAELAQSSRRAFVARLPRDQQLPRVLDPYWRGQVLTRNEGMRWIQDSWALRSRENSAAIAPDTAPVRQEIHMEGRFGGAFFALDYPVAASVVGRGSGKALREMWGHVFLTPRVERGGQVVNVSSALALQPAETLSPAEREALTRVPLAAQVRDLAPKVIPTGVPLPKAFDLLQQYFRTGHFEYSLTPGTMDSTNVGAFLTHIRKGFCEHYAASAANLLRASGYPAVVVVGYWGGEWNPVSRSFLIRDRDAHAWVEAWDDTQRRWLRFDPTRTLDPIRFEKSLADVTSLSWWNYLTYLPAAAWENFGVVGEGFETLVTWSEETFPELRPGTVALVLLGVAAVLFLGPWLLARHGRGQTDRALTRIEEAFLREISRNGGTVEHSDTLRRLASRLAIQKPELGSLAQVVAELLEEAKYGRGTPDRAALRRSLRALKKFKTD